MTRIPLPTRGSRATRRRRWFAPGFALLAVALLGSATSGCGRRTSDHLYQHEAVWPMPPSATGIPAPRSLCTTTNGELVVLDTIGRVLVYDSDSTLVRQWKMPATSVGRPEGIVELLDGSILVADTHYHQMVKFSPDGVVLATWGSKGEGPGEFIYPVAVTQATDGSIYVAEYGGNDRIQVFTRQGDYLRSFGSFGTDEGQFQRCSGLTFLKGRLYIADAINNRIQVYTPEGERVATFSAAGDTAFRFPYDITTTPEGTLAVIEYSAGRITLIDGDGGLIGRYGTTGRGEGGFATPWGIAAGGDGRLFVADTGNHRIVVVHP